MKVENGTSNRGAVLLAELKALVDSLPHHQRGNVIKMLEITFRELNADCQGRHSIGVQPEARTAIDSPPGRPRLVLIQGMNSKRKSRIGARSEDEIHVEAIAGAHIVANVDGAGIMVVTVEHCAAPNIALKQRRRKLPEMTTVIREA